MGNKKILGHKARYQRLTANIREDLYKWLKDKAEKESKSIAVILNEIIEKAKSKEKNED